MEACSQSLLTGSSWAYKDDFPPTLDRVHNGNGGDLGRRYCQLSLAVVNDEVEPGKTAYTGLAGVPRAVCQEDRTPEMELKMLATRQPSDTSPAKSEDNPPMVDKTKDTFLTPATNVHPARVSTLTGKTEGTLHTTIFEADRFPR